MRRREFLAAVLLLLAGCGRRRDRIVVGSKNFTEQLVLGELLAQLLEAANVAVDRRFYLAGTYICHQALLAGRIDLYVEYTGTALAAILKEPVLTNHTVVYERVRNEYQRRFGLTVLPPLGFDNSFAIVMRGADARRDHLTRLSQLAPVASRLRMGVGYEFLERRDGYPGLVNAYGLKFAEPPRVMDLGLMYRALEGRQVDLIAAANTDGLIAARDFVVLEDDRHYFPPYDAVVIARPDALRHAGVSAAVSRITGRLNADIMRRLNYAVDGEKQDAARVAHEFLTSAHLA